MVLATFRRKVQSKSCKTMQPWEFKITKRKSFEIDHFITKSKARITNSLNLEFEYHHLATSRSKKFLRKFESKRMNMLILFVDLKNSTKMSSELPSDKLTRIIRIFSQEMAYTIEFFGGFVLKYVGDAVIGYFPWYEKPLDAVKNSVYCAKTMGMIIKNVINPIFLKSGYPSLDIKISIDFGKNSIVRYGADVQKSHIDIIGLSINLAAKMQGLGKTNQVIIGKKVYDKLSESQRKYFKRLLVDSRRWPYHNLKSKGSYPVFWCSLNSKLDLFC